VVSHRSVIVGGALIAGTDSAFLKLGLMKKNMSRHIAAAPSRMGKKAQRDSSGASGAILTSS
jgi:hypothetical protein